MLNIKHIMLSLMISVPSITSADPLSKTETSPSSDLSRPFLEQLPPARRVFTVDLDHDGQHELLVAHEEKLTALQMRETQGRALWEIKGPGVTQLMTIGDVGRGPELFIAWGMGRGQMKAPLVIQAHNLKTGQGREIWRQKTARTQAVSLQLINIDSDPELELVFAHFVDKYHTRRVILDQLNTAKPKSQVGQKIRMGTSWLFANVDNEPGLDEIIGRVYGDERGEYGDLIIRQKRTSNVLIPTERGVKGVWFFELDGEASLYISDGWVAAYGKKAHARLKRVRWLNKRPVVELLVSSPQEFTFFQLFFFQDPQRGPLLFAQGNKAISLITPQPKGSWLLSSLLKVPPIVNVAIGRQGQRWYAYLPKESGVEVKLLTLP